MMILLNVVSVENTDKLDNAWENKSEFLWPILEIIDVSRPFWLISAYIIDMQNIFQRENVK